MKKNIRSQASEVIYRVLIQCLPEYQAGHILSNLEDVYPRTASITVISDQRAKEGKIWNISNSWKKQNWPSKKRN